MNYNFINTQQRANINDINNVITWAIEQIAAYFNKQGAAGADKKRSNVGQSAEYSTNNHEPFDASFINVTNNYL